MHSSFRLLSFLALLSLSALAQAGEVWVVDAGGGGDFIDIQAAVDQAVDQDTILVRPGDYRAFVIDDEALAIAADGMPRPRVVDLVAVSSLAPGRNASFSGLQFRGGFEVKDCAGTVTFTECEFREPDLATGVGFYNNPDVEPGLHRILNCEDVVFSNSVLIGRDGDTVHWCGDIYDGAHGENGLYASNSTVTLYSCIVEGGEGGFSTECSAHNCSIAQCEPAYPSSGGHGIAARSNARVYLDDTFPVGGPRGDHCDCDGFGPGDDGERFHSDDTAILRTAHAPALSLGSPLVLREDERLSLAVTGPVGANVWMLWSVTPDWTFLGLDTGILHLNKGQLQHVPLGTVPGNGELLIDVLPPPLPGGEQGLHLYVQPFALDDGSRLLGNVRDLALVDASF